MTKTEKIAKQIAKALSEYHWIIKSIEVKELFKIKNTVYDVKFVIATKWGDCEKIYHENGTVERGWLTWTSNGNLKERLPRL